MGVRRKYGIREEGQISMVGTLKHLFWGTIYFVLYYVYSQVELFGPIIELIRTKGQIVRKIVDINSITTKMELGSNLLGYFFLAAFSYIQPPAQLSNNTKIMLKVI